MSELARNDWDTLNGLNWAIVGGGNPYGKDTRTPLGPEKRTARERYGDEPCDEETALPPVSGRQSTLFEAANRAAFMEAMKGDGAAALVGIDGSGNDTDF